MLAILTHGPPVLILILLVLAYTSRILNQFMSVAILDLKLKLVGQEHIICLKLLQSPLIALGPLGFDLSCQLRENFFLVMLSIMSAHGALSLLRKDFRHTLDTKNVSAGQLGRLNHDCVADGALCLKFL